MPGFEQQKSATARPVLFLNAGAIADEHPQQRAAVHERHRWHHRRPAPPLGVRRELSEIVSGSIIMIETGWQPTAAEVRQVEFQTLQAARRWRRPALMQI